MLPLLFVLKRLLVTMEMFPVSSVVDSTLFLAISTGIWNALLNPPQGAYPSVWRVPCDPPRDVFSLLRDHLCDVCVTNHFQLCSILDLSFQKGFGKHKPSVILPKRRKTEQQTNKTNRQTKITNKVVNIHLDKMRKYQMVNIYSIHFCRLVIRHS